MKSNITKAVGAGIIALSVAVLPSTLPAQAQTTTQPGTTTTPGVRVYEQDDGFDWGWLGLLGLLGLAGLAGRKRNDEPTRYRDPNANVGSSTYRE